MPGVENHSKQRDSPHPPVHIEFSSLKTWACPARQNQQVLRATWGFLNDGPRSFAHKVLLKWRQALKVLEEGGQDPDNERRETPKAATCLKENLPLRVKKLSLS